MTHYETLDIPFDATDEEIRKAYRAQALKWHPDKNPDKLDEALRKMQALNKAKDVLYDPQKRAAYDRQLAAQLDKDNVESKKDNTTSTSFMGESKSDVSNVLSTKQKFENKYPGFLASVRPDNLIEKIKTFNMSDEDVCFFWFEIINDHHSFIASIQTMSELIDLAKPLSHDKLNSDQYNNMFKKILLSSNELYRHIRTMNDYFAIIDSDEDYFGIGESGKMQLFNDFRDRFSQLIKQGVSDSNRNKYLLLSLFQRLNIEELEKIVSENEATLKPFFDYEEESVFSKSVLETPAAQTHNQARNRIVERVTAGLFVDMLLAGSDIRMKGFDFFPMFSALFESFSDTILELKSDFSHKNYAMFLGRTGNGMSTLIANQLGHTLARKQQSRWSFGLDYKEESSEKRPIIGHTITQTKGAAIYPSKPTSESKSTMVYVDTTGKSDTSGYAANVCNAIAVNMLAEYVPHHLIAIVVQSSLFSDGRGNRLFELIRNVGRSFENPIDPMIWSEIFWVVNDTRIKNEVNFEEAKQDIAEEIDHCLAVVKEEKAKKIASLPRELRPKNSEIYKQILQAYKETGRKDYDKIKSSFPSEYQDAIAHIFEFDCEKILLKLIYKENIIVADLAFQPDKTRELLTDALDSRANKLALKSSANDEKSKRFLPLNFYLDNVSEACTAFQRVLIEMAAYFNNIYVQLTDPKIQKFYTHFRDPETQKECEAELTGKIKKYQEDFILVSEIISRMPDLRTQEIPQQFLENMKNLPSILDADKTTRNETVRVSDTSQSFLKQMSQSASLTVSPSPSPDLSETTPKPSSPRRMGCGVSGE